MNRLRVVFYARVSTDSEDQLHSFEAQKEFFTKYIFQQDGMEFIRGYADEGISGTNTKRRKQFLKMIEDAKDGKFDLILTKEVSRFARNTVDTLYYTRELSRINVGVVFTNDGIDTRDRDGELRLSIMASLAQDESRKISDRVQWAVKRNFEKGVVHGIIPFGYRRDEHNNMYIYEPEAIVVRKVFDLYLEGNGFASILKLLKKDAYCSEYVQNWCTSKIERMLKNEKYCGDLVQGKSYTVDYLTKTRKKQVDPSKTYYIENHHEAIIDKKIFNKAQKEKKRRSALAKRPNRSSYSKASVFSNRVICSKCGSMYCRKTKTVNDIQYTRWTCSKKLYIKAKACNGQSVKEPLLYEIMKHIYQYLNIDKHKIITMLKRVLDKTDDTDHQKNNQLKYERQLDDLNIKINRLLDLNIQGMITGDLFKLKYETLNNERQDLEQKIDYFRKNNNKEQHLKNINKLMNYIKTNLDDWNLIKDKFISKTLFRLEVIDKKNFKVYLISHDIIDVKIDNDFHFSPECSKME